MQNSIKHYWVVLIGFLLMTVASSSQNLSQIDLLSTSDGLSFRDVRSVVQDSLGLMWFGTNQGINRYDGYNFKLYNSDKSNPYYIERETILGNLVVENEKNFLWYIANDYLYKLNTVTDQSYLYDTAKGVCGSVLYLHKDHFNNIYIVTDDHWMVNKEESRQYLQKLVDDSFVVVASVSRDKNEYTAISSNQTGEICWTTSSNGTQVFDKNGELVFHKRFDNYDWFGQDMYLIESYFDSRNIHYVFPKSRGGVEIYDRVTDSLIRIIDTPEVMYHFEEDFQHNSWFASTTGLYKLNSSGQVSSYTNILKSQLDYFKINDTFLDNKQLLWLATDNGLIKVKVEEKLVEQIYRSNKEGWGNTMRSIFKNKNGNIMAFCEIQKKLIQIDSNYGVREFEIKPNKNLQNPVLFGARYFEIFEDSNAIYTMNDRLIKVNLNDGSYKDYYEFAPRLNVTTANPLEKLNDGKLMFGFSLSKLTIFDPLTEQSQLVFPEISPEEDAHYLRVILQGKEKDIVWIGTRNNGLIKINRNGTIIDRYDSQSDLGLSKDWVLSLYEEAPNQIWVGLYGGGLNYLNLRSNKVTSYTTNDGLSDNNVVGILPTEANKLWVSTYNGISYFDMATKSFRNFYLEDGLTHNEFNYTSHYKDESGTLYFGGMNGINAFKPDDLLQKETTSSILLTNISTYNRQTNSSSELDLLQKPTKELVLSPYDQYFQINWTIPNYFDNDKHQFYTKLEGLDDDWYFQGNSNSIRYNKLPADKYVLRIRGTDANGIMTTEELLVPITVQQIFYKKWWFVLMVIVCVALIVYSIFNYRLQQLVAMERLRDRISSDLHDDVGSMLSGLAMQSELLQINARDEDKSKLQKIADLSRLAVSQMRDLVWSIDSRREHVSDLIEKMQELAEELLLPKNITFKIDSTSVNFDKKLSADIKQNLFLIFKEAMTNVVRHSNATHVAINLNNTADGCQLIIKDNGGGECSIRNTGLGLSNMAMRAHRLKGNIDFDRDNGFEIYVDLPFTI